MKSQLFRSWMLALGFVSIVVLPWQPAIGSTTDDAVDVSIDSAKLAQIPERMRQFVKAKQISGAVTLVVYQGRTIHLEAAGEANIEKHLPMRTDTIFAIASMTKPITATALMMLEEKGKLSLDDPVSKYIPQFANAALPSGPSKRPLTIRDVITHTSGLGGSQKTEGSLAHTAELLAKRPLSFQPGTKWQYSPGPTVCGRIIEVVSGESFDRFLERHIFQPLKMVDTTFNPTPEQQKRVAQLYKPGEEGKSLVATTSWISDFSKKRTPNPCGGLFSTAADMGRFYQAILNGGELDGARILRSDTVRRMLALQTGDLKTGFTPGNGWAIGWCLVRHPQGVSRMLSPGTFGHGGAHGTQGWVDPQRKMIFVLMIQRTGFGNSDASTIREAFQRLGVEAVEH